MKMKRAVTMLLVVIMAFSVFATGCAGIPGRKVKVGMVAGFGTIDDKSFNQSAYDGILKYKKDNGKIEEKYLQSQGQQRADYLNAINSLADEGYKIIVTPGNKFETAVNEAAVKYKDVSFILFDGITHNGDYKFIRHDNVLSIRFNDHEAGFLAGVAAALSTKSGKLGFIGGMEVPSVQRFGWGYQAGVKYANDKLGANAQIISYVYQGSFNQVDEGQKLAAGMYDQGIDIIFQAAGGTGIGVFNEAKNRVKNGSEVYVIGVDADQYNIGKISNDAGAKSVTLTSAVRRIDTATYNYIDAKLKGKFPGGEVITFSLKNGGVGIPESNPNLTDDVMNKINEVKQEMVEGKVKAPANQEELNEFLSK